jgi:hypothetical protein
MLPFINSEGLVPAASDHATMSGRCWQNSLCAVAKATGSAATVAVGVGDALGVGDVGSDGAGDVEPEGVIDIEDPTAARSEGVRVVEMA